jgi:hypothetical protein
MILLCIISCNDLNGSVDRVGDEDGDEDGDDSFGFNNVLSFIMQNKV